MRAGSFFLVVVLALAAREAPRALAQQQVPRGKLAGTVTPVAYRIDLTVVPSRPRFSGHVEIDVIARGGESTMFLHGRDLKVKRAELRQRDKKSAATYSQVDPSGVARIGFGRALAAGPATLGARLRVARARLRAPRARDQPLERQLPVLDANGLCSTAAADKVEASLRPQVHELGRGALPLDRAVEIVRSCAATAATHGAEIDSALRALFARPGS